jgi:hypothetical protein
MTVAVAFNKEIKFTIADGATDFVVGDSFKVRVGIESPATSVRRAEPDRVNGIAERRRHRDLSA